MAARILILLNLIKVAVLLQGIEVERLEDIVECLFEGIRTHTEVGIVEFQSGGVYIELQLHVESLCHVIEHVTKRTCIFRLEGLSPTCRGGKQSSYK